MSWFGLWGTKYHGKDSKKNMDEFDQYEAAVIEYDFQPGNMMRHLLGIYVIVTAITAIQAFIIDDSSWFSYNNNSGIISPVITLVKGLTLGVIYLIGQVLYDSPTGLPFMEEYIGTVCWVLSRSRGDIQHRLAKAFWALVYHGFGIAMMFAASYTGFYLNSRIVIAATGNDRGIAGTVSPSINTTFYSYLSILGLWGFIVFVRVIVYECIVLGDYTHNSSWVKRSWAAKSYEKAQEKGQFNLTFEQYIQTLFYVVTFFFTYNWFGGPPDLNYLLGAYYYTAVNSNDTGVLVAFAFIGSFISSIFLALYYIAFHPWKIGSQFTWNGVLKFEQTQRKY